MQTIPRLQNKIAIVTGAGHGIGRAISEVFAEEGAHVVMCSMNMEAGEAAAAEIRKNGRGRKKSVAGANVALV